MVLLIFPVFLVVFIFVLFSLPAYVGIILSAFFNMYKGEASPSIDHDELRDVIGSLAICMVVLAFVAYFGLGAGDGLSYDCSMTWKSPWYDYLG